MINKILIKIVNSVINKLLRKYKIPDEVLLYLRSASAISSKGKVKYPTELLPLGARLYSQGFLNFMVLQTNLDWVLPYWACKQYDYKTPSFIPRALYPISLNASHRDWTMFGNLDSKLEGIVDPRGLTTPWINSYSVDVWLKGADGWIFPSRLTEFEQSVPEHAPVVTNRFSSDAADVATRIYAVKAREKDLCRMEVTVTNVSEEKIETSLAIAVRPFNPEGVTTLFDLEFKYPGYFILDGNIGPVFREFPSRIACSSYERGDVALALDGASDRSSASCPAGLASGAAIYDIALKKGETYSVNLAFPMRAIKANLDEVQHIKASMDTIVIDDVISSWEERLFEGMLVRLPDKELERLFNVNKYYLLLLDDAGSITPGPATYHHFWFRDAAYMVYALDLVGYHSLARRILFSYPYRQDVNGFFISQNGEWDSNGQAIWALMNHYYLTRDKRFLREVYPSISRGVGWIREARLLKGHENTPHHGLLPAGFSAEHLGNVDYYFWDNFWCLAGVREALFAAKILNKVEDTIMFHDLFEDYRRSIERAMDHAQEKLGDKLIPAGPYRRMDCGAIGSICAVYPLDLLAYHNTAVRNTLNYILTNFCHNKCFFQDMVHSGINAYLTLHLAQSYLMGRDKTCLEIFEEIRKLATPTLTYPEAIHPSSGGGCMGDGHHGWAAAEILTMIRNLIFMTHNNILELFPVPIESWFKEGSTISVKDGGSIFGAISFTLKVGKDLLEIDLEPRFLVSPDKIAINIPLPLAVAEADGSEVAIQQRGDISYLECDVTTRRLIAKFKT